MSKPTILICDDEAQRERGWRDRLLALPEVSESFEVKTARIEGPGAADNDTPSDTTSPLASIVAALEQRRLAARPGLGIAPGDDAAAQQFDDADILVVDYDLLMLAAESQDEHPLPGHASHLTGERLAYLARCYSTCGLIVSMNQFSADVPSFDLNLAGQFQSFADINVASAEIDNPGLWSTDRHRWEAATPPRYRPWRWPVLPDALDAHQKRVDELANGALDMPVLEYLGFTTDVLDVMPRAMLEALDTGLDTNVVTFRQIAEQSGVGYRRKDRPLDDAFTSRVAAARVAHWIERVVLPAQDVLVDAPHLALRYPSVLTGERVDQDRWNATAQPTWQPFLTDRSPINDAVFESARLPRSEWASRATWFWSRVNQNREIAEVAEPWRAQAAPYVFAEDTSSFVTREQVHQFVADVASPFARRFVERVPGVEYRPAIRFVL